MILVTGASGNSGRLVVEALARRGSAVRAATRSGRPVEGAREAVRLDFGAPGDWPGAIDGTTAIYLLRPPAIANIAETLGPFTDYARAHGAPHVVFLSVAGAERMGYLPHAKVEAALKTGGRKGWTILRPGYFAQNLQDAFLRDITEDDRLYLPAGTGKVAFVDLRDVAEVAADALTHPALHDGAAHTLTGPRAVSFAEVASHLSRAAGRSIRYQRASPPAYALHLRRRGQPWGAVAVQTLLNTGLRWGQAEAVDPTLAGLLGRPATDIATYVADHAALWAPAAD